MKVMTQTGRRVAASNIVGELRGTLIPCTGAGEVIGRIGGLYANGFAVSRAKYSKLFAKYGTKYGPGDGSTTFNLPDFRGMGMVFPLDGKTAGTTRLTVASGTRYGEETHALTLGETPKHVHGPGTLNINGGTHTHGSITLTISGNNNTGTTAGTVCCAWQSGASGFTPSVAGTTASATHAHPTGEIAGAMENGATDGLAGTAHSNVPPTGACFVLVMYQ